MQNYNLALLAMKIYSLMLKLVNKYRFTMNFKEFNKNIIDPIKLTFDSKIYKKTIEQLVDSEIIRQIDKSNNNLIGYFHQNIFNYFDNGWTVPKTGFDVVNENKKIYVEIKNKHNTMNSKSTAKTFMIMQGQVLKNPTSTCVLVEVIAKKSQDIAWKVSLDGLTQQDDRIRRVSIDKFYSLVTERDDSFKNLCTVLPTVIGDVVNTLNIKNVENTVFNELKSLSPNLLKSIYMLSFKKYEGFNSFDIDYTRSFMQETKQI